MSHKCCVPSCESESPQRYRFATDNDRRREWVRRIFSKFEDVDMRNYYVCQIHFHPECIGPVKLNKYSLPTLHLPYYQQGSPGDHFVVRNDISRGYTMPDNLINSITRVQESSKQRTPFIEASPFPLSRSRPPLWTYSKSITEETFSGSSVETGGLASDWDLPSTCVESSELFAMGRICYICQRKASKADRISLHKFPKNSVVLNKWLKACNLSPTDNLTNIFICSMHFYDDDIIVGNDPLNIRPCLRSTAIPSIDVPNPVGSDIYENFDTNYAEMISIKEEAIVHDDINVNDLPSALHVSEDCSKSSIEQCDNSIKRRRSSSSSDDSYVEDEGKAGNGMIQESCTSTTNIRRGFPRYISEITIDDVSTPEGASRILDFIRDEDKKKNKFIKSLQDRNRKFIKRISKLEQEINLLKRKNMSFSNV